MNPLAGMLSDPTVIRLAMILLHFLWQGCLFALATIVTLGALRNAMPQLRYLVLLGLFVLMAASPIVTFHALPTHVSLGELEPTVVRVADGGRRFATSNAEEQATHEPSKTSSVGIEDAPHQTELTPMPIGGETTDKAVMPPGDTRFELLTTGDLSWGSWLVVAWSIGVALLSMRLLYGLLAAERLKRRGVQPIEQALQKTARRIQRQLAIWREVPVLVSKYVNVPTLVGYFKPVILMPTSAMLGLTPQQFEAILAHELSHVARHDYLTNVLQCVVETLLFYHPAVWWMSRRLRQEREHCCDDMATAICDDRRVYAQAIYIVTQARNDSVVPALAATGSPLVQRIKRLAERDTKKSNQSSGWLAALVMIIAVSLLGLGLQASVAATEESASRMELHTPGGIVDIEMYDSRVEIGFDSETGLLNITGAGPNEIKIKLGPQQFPKTGGEPDNWLTITRGEKPVVRFRLRTIFDVNDLKLERTFFDEGPPVYSVDFSSNGKQLICGGYFGAPFSWLDAEGGNVFDNFGDSHAPVFVSFSPDGLHAAAGCISGKVLVWNLEAKKLVQEFSHGSMITAIEYSPDGQRLATGALDKSICVWDLPEGRELLRYLDHDDYIFDLAFSPTGNHVASVSADATLRIWDSTNGLTQQLIRHPAPVWSVAYSNDGHQIVTGTGGRLIGKAWEMNIVPSQTNLVFVWNTSTGEELLRFQGHQNVIKGIDVSPDRRYAVTASLDRTLRLWDMQTGMELSAVPGQGWVTSVQFSPDGRKVAATGGIRRENGQAIHYPAERLRLFSLVNTVPYMGASRQNEQPPRLDVFDAEGKEPQDDVASGEADNVVLDAVLRAATGFYDAREKVQILEVAATKWPLDLGIRKRLNHQRSRLRDIESLLRGSGSFDTQLAGQRISQREHLP